MKAKTKEQYRQAWKAEIKGLNQIALDLPDKELTSFLDALDYVKSFVDIAANNLDIPEK